MDRIAAAQVAPLVGAWIEITLILALTNRITVAPLVGAWIEIDRIVNQKEWLESLLSWERGLK